MIMFVLGLQAEKMLILIVMNILWVEKGKQSHLC